MWLPSGFGGFILSIAVPTLLWGFFYSERKKISAYNLDPQGKPAHLNRWSGSTFILPNS